MAEPALVPRASDPRSSLAGVQRVRNLKDPMYEAALKLVEFTDLELKRQYEHDQDCVIDRGLVARTRLDLERRGRIDRLPETEGDTELRFRLAR